MPSHLWEQVREIGGPQSHHEDFVLLDRIDMDLTDWNCIAVSWLLLFEQVQANPIGIICCPFLHLSLSLEVYKLMSKKSSWLEGSTPSKAISLLFHQPWVLRARKNKRATGRCGSQPQNLPNSLACLLFNRDMDCQSRTLPIGNPLKVQRKNAVAWSLDTPSLVSVPTRAYGVSCALPVISQAISCLKFRGRGLYLLPEATQLDTVPPGQHHGQDSW